MTTADALPTGSDQQTLGIDVSKAWLDLVVWPSQQHRRVANDAGGWAALATELAIDPPNCIVLEATGGYEVGVVVALDAVGLPPVVVNPLVLRRYAQSLPTAAKTDRVDATVLARFGAERRPVPRPLPSELARDLAALLAEREQLTAQLVATKNRRQQARPIVWERLDAQRHWLEAQRTVIDRQLAALVASDPVWQARVEQLASVPGIGVLTATIVAVGLPELGQVTGKQIAALVGVAPIAHESGRLRKPRQIRGGRRTIRRALYLAMLSTIRCDPELRAHYRQLRDRGKPTKVALIACVRRLLGRLTAMVREGLTWDQLQTRHPISA